MNATMTIQHRYECIQEQVSEVLSKCGRTPDSLCMVAVSKTHPIDVLEEAIQAGIRVFGENKIQEAVSKIESLDRFRLSWHFIGHLQTNKVNKAVGAFDLIHSIDRPKLIAKLNEEAMKKDCKVDGLIQLNLSGEETKSGASFEALEELMECIRQAERVRCKGLMTIPPPVDVPDEARPFFQQLRSIGEQYRNDLVGPGEKVELSMGMSHDYLVAIEEGATIVRVGTALFGPRDYSPTI